MIDSGYVYKGYIIRNLPESIPSTIESDLSKYIMVTITDALVIPAIKTQFIDKTSTAVKVLISFNFPGFQTPPPFSYKLKINSDLIK